MEPKIYFSAASSTAQRQYDALRAFYVDELSEAEAASKSDFSLSYFRKLRNKFVVQCRKNELPKFFVIKKTGPKKLLTKQSVIDEIIVLRKQNHSILDIKGIMHGKGQSLSLDTIDKILKREGFAPLPKRTKQERRQTVIPKKIIPPKSEALELQSETFSTEHGAGPLIFLPLLAKLDIFEAIKKADFPKTSVLNDVSSILSFIALKIMSKERLSHDDSWGLDRALGLFANLNVLPKSTTLSTYSYRVNRNNNICLLKQLANIFTNEDDQSCFNLDFKAIPHWGDDSVLEKHWSGSRNKALKSILSLIVENQDTGFMNYTDATPRHNNQSNTILEFVDFWKQGTKQSPKMLVFDSKLTTYENLNALNKDGIKFLTLRRRGEKLVCEAFNMPKENWRQIEIKNVKRKHNKLLVFDNKCKLRHYDGEVRQIIITGHGRRNPTFLISNDLDSSTEQLINRYARRWLVEQAIAEQIVFFHLNQASSSIVVKVDFDLTLSLLVHNLYRKLAKHLPGFESATVQTLHRKFVENGAKVEIADNNIIVKLKKKTHLPILFEVPWLTEQTWIPWLSAHIQFQGDTTA